MSSHHFVREKQEPALFIHSEQSLSFELLEQLLEWSPYVIADEHVLYLLNHEPIKIDLVLQQELSDEDLDTWTSNQSDIKIIKLEKDVDKLTSLLRYLESENHSALSLLACNDEHFLELQKTNFNLDIIQYTVEYKGFFLEHDFKKWKEKDAVIEIIGEVVETKNLVRCTDNTWKVMQDGLVEILLNKKTYIKEYNLGQRN